MSVYPVSNSEDGAVAGYAASNSVSADTDADDAADLIDVATEAGANQVSGPGMSSRNAEELYRQALAKAVGEARERAQVLAKAPGAASVRSPRSSRAPPRAAPLRRARSR